MRMKSGTNLELVRRATLWLLAVVTVAYVTTGFGITEFRTVEAMTFGLLNKNLAFRIHNGLTVPAFVILVSHIVVGVVLSKRRAKP